MAENHDTGNTPARQADATSKSDVPACDHTDDPWQSQHEWSEDGAATIIGGIDGPDDGHFHFTVICEMNTDAPDYEGNRRLVIAAPALLKALQGIAANDLICLTGAGRIVAEKMRDEALAALAKIGR